ncbi:MAG: phosphoribosylglycinamide formyltransferase [Acidobacteriota bacterium]|nr:phosphoribosylglycinamide formyltransferase [Acidobacteriota bacterium]
MVSGSGTILDAILDAGLDVALVVADRPCRALRVAAEAGVTTELVDRRAYGGFSANFDREAYSAALVATLSSHDIDLVAMAGFGTVTTGTFPSAYAGRVLNTHPSLLPDFKGWHAVAQALAAHVAESGCTVHLATAELDEGPILAQRRVPVYAEDTEDTLHERIKAVERTLYPVVITRVMAALAQGREPATLAGAMEET